MAKVTISGEFIVKAMQSATVRKALAERADRVAQRAEQIAAQEEVDAEFTRTDGTRPKGRPFSRVSTDAVGQEWGDSTTGRLRILGRAAEEG